MKFPLYLPTSQKIKDRISFGPVEKCWVKVGPACQGEQCSWVWGETTAHPKQLLPVHTSAPLLSRGKSLWVPRPSLAQARGSPWLFV